MGNTDETNGRNAAETRERIVLAAQAIFSEKGYPHAGMREIASRAGVALSLVTKYFGTKARLFEEALTTALIDVGRFQADRARFGELVVQVSLDPNLQMSAPAMIALSLGDAEARQVCIRVTRDHIFAPMAEWLGEPNGLERAVNLFMMTLGLSIFGRQMRDEAATAADPAVSNRLFAQALQALVDN